MFRTAGSTMNAEQINRLAQKTVVALCSLCVGVLLARALGL
jgi:hypothetical protein